MSYTKPSFEVADIIREYRNALEERGRLSGHQKKVFTNLAQCRTAALGYHKDKCDNPQCGNTHISYNSCRDRHCPKCNGIKREKWVCMREEDLLPVMYYHVVFTVPDIINPLFLAKPVTMYNLLFSSAWETIKKFSNDHKHLGAQTGMIAILHSWGQNLCLHPHIHCIIPAGGITKNGKWKNTRQQGKFLFPVKALSKVFRGIFSDGLISFDLTGVICLEHKFNPQKKYLHPFYKKKWVVYAKLPMHNPLQVLSYIGRYTHRIAISNHRIKNIVNDKVFFSWFNYQSSKPGIMELNADEFLQRFALHILPCGFMKIRHYGILGSKNKANALDLARRYLNAEKPVSKKGWNSRELFFFLYGRHAFTCPVCNKGKMVTIEVVTPKSRGSPIIKILPNYNFSKQ